MKKKRRISWLAIPGMILVLAGLIGLYSVPEVSQYAFLPAGGDYNELLARAEEKWADAFPAISLHGTAEEMTMKAGSSTRSEITLIEAAGGYFEVYPRPFAAGRPLSRGDGKNRVIVLDGELAFQLFGDRDPLGQTVSLEEKSYEVVGVAAHTRRIGETGTCTAWIPLGAEGAPSPRVMVLSTGGRTGSSLQTVFETGAGEVLGEGQAIFTGKERTRGTVILRFVGIILMIRLLAVWIRWLRGWIGRRVEGLREEMKRKYPGQMWAHILLESLGIMGLTGATVLAAAGLAVWASQLMLAFPEWVPETLTDPESIARRFRELTAAAAVPVQFRTPELAEIRFWSGMIRWGTVTALLGWALRKSRLLLPEAEKKQ